MQDDDHVQKPYSPKSNIHHMILRKKERKKNKEIHWHQDHHLNMRVAICDVLQKKVLSEM
jgi:hypothetical protein